MNRSGNDNNLIRIMSVFVAAIIFFAIVYGCGLTKPAKTPSAVGTGVTLSGDYKAPEIEETTGEYTDMEALKEARTALGITPENIEQKCREQAGRYYYDHMDAKYHELYAEILMILEKHASEVLIDASNTEEIKYAFLCVFGDHPEIYWIEGYTYGHYSGFLKEVFVFSGKYTYTAAECELMQPKIDAYVADATRGLSDFTSQYDKVKHIYDYVVKNTEYDKNARDNQNILSVCVYGKSVCQGYAKAIQYLLNSKKIQCCMVTGRTYDGTGHAWNLVNIDGEYYYLDATWGEGSDIRDVNYDFLNVSDVEMASTHFPDNPVEMPSCTATEANYYVREGLYYSAYNEQKLKTVFKQAKKSGDGYVAIKLDDRATFDNFYDRLVNQGEVFKLLPEGVETVQYTSNESQNILIFIFQ